MDNSLTLSVNLRCLILAGCCVQDFPGEFLPRGLMMLEMYCNQLERLDLLTCSCPPYIIYLGLGRNYLTQGVLGPLSKFEFLVHLDLSDNDIEDLVYVASACQPLTNLSALMLQGNPCSYVMNYAHIVATCLPKLFFLDGKVLKRSNNIILNNKNCKETASMSTLYGTLQISVIRILSFPQPKTEKFNKKKVTHTFRVEVLCPLLLKYMPENKESFIKLKPASITSEKNLTNMKKNNRSSSKSLKGNRTKRKASKSSRKPKLNAGKTKKSLGNSQHSKKVLTTNDNKENVEDQFDENLCFVSERKKWSKIMEFAEPTIEIPRCDLTLLRNVFRSKMVIYITHLKTILPVKAKTKTKKKTGKKSMAIEETPDKKDAAKEFLVNKTVMAKLTIPLHSIVWTEKSLDYSWSQPYPTRVVEESTLKDLKYVVKNKQIKSKKGKQQGNSTEIQIPKELTVHVAIGVKRSGSD